MRARTSFPLAFGQRVPECEEEIARRHDLKADGLLHFRLVEMPRVPRDERIGLSRDRGSQNGGIVGMNHPSKTGNLGGGWIA